MLMLPNCPQYLVAFFGALRAGALVVPLSPGSSADRIEALLGDCGAQTVISLDLYYRELLKILERTLVKRVVVASFNEILTPWQGFIYRATKGRRPPPLRHGDFDFWGLIWAMPPYPPEVKIQPQDPAVLFYDEAGIDPPAIVMNHQGLVAGAAQLESWLPDLRPGREMVTSGLPLIHPLGQQTGLLFPIRIGATILMFPRPDPKMVIHGSRSHRSTMVSDGSLQLEDLARHNLLDQASISSVHTFLALGPAMERDLKRNLESISGGQAIRGHQPAGTIGLTHLELVGKSSQPVGSMGLPLPEVECRIVDEAGEVLAPGAVGDAVGELQIRGPQSMAGWWDSSTQSPRPNRSKKWHPTGEKVRMEETGFFYQVAAEPQNSQEISSS